MPRWCRLIGSLRDTYSFLLLMRNCTAKIWRGDLTVFENYMTWTGSLQWRSKVTVWSGFGNVSLNIIFFKFLPTLYHVMFIILFKTWNKALLTNFFFYLFIKIRLWKWFKVTWSNCSLICVENHATSFVAGNWAQWPETGPTKRTAIFLVTRVKKELSSCQL